MFKTQAAVLILVTLTLSACGRTSPEVAAPPGVQGQATAGLPTPGTVYQLRVRHSGKMLDVPGADPRDGLQLQQWDSNARSNQRWTFEAVDGGYYRVISRLSGKALGVAQEQLAQNGAKVALWPATQGNPANKQWRLVAAGDAFRLVNRASGKVLDVAGGGMNNGARVLQWPAHSGNNQLWTLVSVGGAPTPPPPTPTPPPAPTPTPTPPPPPPAPAPSTGSYQQNLELIRAASVRNRTLDASAYRNTPMASISATDPNLLGPRSAYLAAASVSGNPEPNFAARGVGTFRTSCEFSHFSYDDPLLYPGKPGAAHLHMNFGNTDVNAYSTFESLRDSGSGTCNGQELNRSAYWVPAMFDAQGNVRIPERVIIYYKGYGLANGKSRTYPDGLSMVTDDQVHRASDGAGGAAEWNFMCSDQFRGDRTPAGAGIPSCDGNRWRNVYGDAGARVTLEMHVKFPNCWTGKLDDPRGNVVLARQGGWFYSDCQERATLPNIEYLVAYPLAPGETTAGWYLASDVDPSSRTRTKGAGASVHADWWGAWKPEINKQWIDNCVNDTRMDVDHGCGFGYLTDGGPTDNAPYPGPALRYRQEYDRRDASGQVVVPMKVPAQTLYRELCPGGPAISGATAAAYCRPQMAAQGLSTTAHSAGHQHP